MKKNGFTLVEIIAVIVILSVIMVLVVPSITDSSKNTREKTYEAKIESFETAAKLYGQDNYRDIAQNSDRQANIKLGKLCEYNYIKADGENCFIEDPRNPSNNLNNNDCYVTISIDTKTKKVTAEYNTEGYTNC